MRSFQSAFGSKFPTELAAANWVRYAVTSWPLIVLLADGLNEGVARVVSSVTYTFGVWTPSSDNATIGYGLRNVNAARIPVSS